MNEFIEAKVKLEWADLKSSYDVIIIGGGGHGLSTAYHLATRHGITNVAVLEKGYIGGGNSGRNTTVIRANYGIPESVKFYQHSLNLYARLEDETDRWMMHKQKGILWSVHTEAGVRQEKARAALNKGFGADTYFVTPEEIADLVPGIDVNTGGGSMPIMGASYSPESSTARHDRVNWSLAEGAMRAGVHIKQRVEVTDLLMDGDRVTGVRTPQGDISAGVVVSAVGGHVSRIAAMAGLRLPIRTHPLQAFVTNHYAESFPQIVSSLDLGFYVSQTARGEMLAGAHIDPQPSYSSRSGAHFLSNLSHSIITLLPFMRDLRILRQWTGTCDMSADYSPIMGHTDVDGLMVTTGWGTWGFKAIPAGGEAMAELIATGDTPDLIAPFSLSRFKNDRTMADPTSTGTH